MKKFIGYEYLWEAPKVWLPDTLICFCYQKGKEEEDHFGPLFETQVPDCEHDGGDQDMEQSKLVE